MVQKFSTGEIVIERQKTVRIDVKGEIVKMRVYNSKENSPDLRMTAVTSDGEVIVSREIGTANCVIYPKNKAASQEFLNLDASGEISHGEGGDNFVVDGVLEITFECLSEKNVIENVVITVR